MNVKLICEKLVEAGAGEVACFSAKDMQTALAGQPVTRRPVDQRLRAAALNVIADWQDDHNGEVSSRLIEALDALCKEADV